MDDRRTSASFALVICGVLGLIEAAFLVVFGGSERAVVVNVLLWLGLGFMLAMLQYVPCAVIVLGMMKLREQQRTAAEALGDENVVKSDPDGERKLHDYLTAINSTEARIGMLQRSDPYVPPEQRQPEGAVRPRAVLNRLGWGIVSGSIFAGAATGFILGLYHGLGAEGSNAPGVVQLIAATLFGGVLASPVGAILGLVFGSIELEGASDAGSSGSETA